MPDPALAHMIAVLILDAVTLRIIWCNEEYADHMAKSHPDELIGHSYEEAVEVMSPVKVPVYRRIAETGVPESGVDYFVDLQAGSSARRWKIHRATPGLLVCIIDWL
jgi:hypothetical protein